MRPVRAKVLYINTFALTGRMILLIISPRAMPWAMEILGFTFPLRAGDFQFSPPCLFQFVTFMNVPFTFDTLFKYLMTLIYLTIFFPP